MLNKVGTDANSYLSPVGKDCLVDLLHLDVQNRFYIRTLYIHMHVTHVVLSFVLFFLKAKHAK